MTSVNNSRRGSPIRLQEEAEAAHRRSSSNISEQEFKERAYPKFKYEDPEVQNSFRRRGDHRSSSSEALEIIVSSINDNDASGSPKVRRKKNNFRLFTVILICAVLYILLNIIRYGSISSRQCSTFVFNPCGFGTCVNNLLGNDYTCVCTTGFVTGVSVKEKSSICVSVPDFANPELYTVPKGYAIDPQLLIHNYGLTSSSFTARNQIIDPSKPILENSIVKIGEADLTSCSFPYTLQINDTTCAALSTKFGPILSSNLSALNHGMNCTILRTGSQVCLQRGSIPDIPLPVLTANVLINDTCHSLVNDYFGGNWSEFHSINPGVNCQALSTSSTRWRSFFGVPQSKIAVQVTTAKSASYAANCQKKKGYGVPLPAGWSCTKLLSVYYKGNPTLFKVYNNGFQCSDHLLSQSSGICLCSAMPVLKSKQCKL